jgi:hypothetical protein
VIIVRSRPLPVRVRVGVLEYALSLARDLAYIAGLVAPINTIRVQLLHQEPVNFDITKTSTYDDTLSRREGTKATAHLFIIGKGVNGITRIHQQKPEKRVYPTLDFTSTIPRSFHT